MGRAHLGLGTNVPGLFVLFYSLYRPGTAWSAISPWGAGRRNDKPCARVATLRVQYHCGLVSPNVAQILSGT
jgi:hypothetical protein